MEILYFAATFHGNQNCILSTLAKNDFSLKLFYFLVDPTQINNDKAHKMPISSLYRFSEPLFFPVYSLIFLARGKRVKLSKIRNAFSFPSIRFLRKVLSGNSRKIVIVRDVPSHGKRVYSYVIRKVCDWSKVSYVVHNQEEMIENLKQTNEVVITPASGQCVHEAEYLYRYGRVWHLPYPVCNADVRYRVPDSDKLTLLATGRYGNKEKRLDMLACALVSLPKELRDQCKLVVCGHGSLRSEGYIRLKEQIQNYQLGNSVQIKLNVDHEHMRELYRSAHLFVFPSVEMGYPFSIPEALAHGVPVVAGHKIKSSDLLKNDWNGFIFESGSQESLNKTLAEAVRKVRLHGRRYSDNAYDTYLMFLQPSNYLERLEEIIMTEFGS